MSLTIKSSVSEHPNYLFQYVCPVSRSSQHYQSLIQLFPHFLYASCHCCYIIKPIVINSSCIIETSPPHHFWYSVELFKAVDTILAPWCGGLDQSLLAITLSCVNTIPAISGLVRTQHN